MYVTYSIYGQTLYFNLDDKKTEIYLGSPQEHYVTVNINLEEMTINLDLNFTKYHGGRYNFTIVASSNLELCENYHQLKLMVDSLNKYYTKY